MKDAKLFDFKENWHMVQPHLNDPDILALLDEGMRDWCGESGNVWNREAGPWAFTTRSGHFDDAMDKANEDPENQAIYDAYTELAEARGLEVFEVGVDEEDPEILALFDAQCEAFDKIVDKYLPQPDTIEWYQCIGACYFLAKWQEALAKKVFPDHKWSTRCVPIKVTGGHTTTVGTGPKGETLIFDVLLFQNCPIEEIIERSSNVWGMKMVKRNLELGLIYKDLSPAENLKMRKDIDNILAMPNAEKVLQDVPPEIFT